MARHLAKLLSLITPKRRCAQFSLCTLLLAVTALCIWPADYVRPVRSLERQLRDPDEELRLMAAARLGYMGPDARSTTKSLLRATDDGSEWVRRMAVWAVSRVSGRPEVLLPFLADGEDEVKLVAAEGILWAGGDAVAVVPSLLALDHDGMYSTEIRDLFSALGPDQAASVLPLLLDKLAVYSVWLETADEDDEQGDEASAAECLGCLCVPAPTVVPALIERLSHERPEVRTAAAEQLLRLGESAKQAAGMLKRRLHDPDPAASAAMAAALGAVAPDDDEFLSVLKRALLSDDHALVNSVTAYVWVLGPRSAAASDDVVARICNPRWISAEAYYRRGRESRVFERLGPPAVSAVDRALKQALANRAVPKAYQEQVKRIGRAAMHIVFPALEYARDRRNTARRAPDVADDPQPARVRAATVRILEWASEQSLKLAVETEQIPVHWLGTVGPAARSAVPTLVAALDDAWFRDDAIIALGGIGKDAAPAVAHLLPLLDSDDAALRHLAREALEKIGVFDEAARARLRPWLTSGDLHEREEAARALAACGEHAEQIIPTLIELAIDPHFNPRAQLQPGDWHSPGVYATLLASMASTGPAAVPMLIDALQSPDPNVRRAAAEALVKIGPTAKGAVPSLIELLDDHDSWDAAAEALGRMGREARAAVPKLLAVFEAVQMPGSPEEYVPIVHALGGIGPDARDALPAVLKLADVDDPEIRHAAVMALARIDPTNSSLVPQLRRLLAEWERSSLIQDAWAESAVSMPDVGLEQIADAVWELGPRAAGLVPDLRRMVTTAPLLEPRVRCYAAFALASFARQRQVAQQCLQNFATTDQAGPLMGSARLASELLQRINGAPPAPTAD